MNKLISIPMRLDKIIKYVFDKYVIQFEVDQADDEVICRI